MLIKYTFFYIILIIFNFFFHTKIKYKKIIFKTIFFFSSFFLKLTIAFVNKNKIDLGSYSPF